MKKIIIALMFVFALAFFSFLVSAECSIPTVKQGDTIELTQSCTDCPDGVNVTKVIFPNNTFAQLGQFEMTANGSNFNLSFSNTNTLGTHIYYSEGNLTGIVIVQSCSFEVTKTGNTLDNPQSIIVIGLILVLILLTWSFLYFGKEIEYVPFKIFLISLGSLFLMFTIGISVNTITELMLIGSVFSATFVNLYRLMLILISAGGIGLMLYIIYMSVRQFYSYRGLLDNEFDD